MSKSTRRHRDDQPRRDASSPPAVDAYFDARGKGRPAKDMLNEVLRDASVLDELARDQEWIDEVRHSTPTPDQTICILNRLGLDPTRFNRRQHRFTLLTRRLSTAAVLAFAFVVGMWARSSLVGVGGSQPVETAHRFERVIESLPIQMDPFDRMRGLMLEVGTTLADPDSLPPSTAPAFVPAPLPAPTTTLPAPKRALLKQGNPPAIDLEGVFDDEIDVESLKAIYKDLGIV